MNPTYYSKLNATTGFIAFVFRDLLDHAGLLADKKINNLRIYKNLLYEEYKEKIYSDKVNDFLEILKDKEVKSKK